MSGASPRRLLVIGLDGFEWSLAATMIAEGVLPNLARLAEASARFDLHHGWARYSGLAWEHFSSGQTPDRLQRWSAVSFDPSRYAVRQPPSSARPFLADYPLRSVVFDVPYFALDRAPNVAGIVGWGAHDPGVALQSRPADVTAALTHQVGPYAAAPWIYGFSWPSPARTAELGVALCRGVKQRSDAARWLLTQRLPDWDLGVVVVSESHSAIEPLWHGIDPRHPLHGAPSAPAARDALRSVYVAIDGLVGELLRAVPDAAVMVFAMHGMGANHADVPAMLLLPELLYRSAFGKPYAQAKAWPLQAGGVPVLGEDEVWDRAMQAVVPWPRSRAGLDRLFGRRAARRGRALADTLAWMPAARYAPFWPQMPAFALPAYYDGQIRLNLAGREAAGQIRRDDYRARRQAVAGLLTACRDPSSGAGVVSEIVFPDKSPDQIGPTEADMHVLFGSNVLGLSHPALGTIGPFPPRRTGGHTGGEGFLLVDAPGVAAGAKGSASAFDVVPTILDLLGRTPGREISGVSLAGRIAEAEAPDRDAAPRLNRRNLPSTGRAAPPI